MKEDMRTLDTLPEDDKKDLIRSYENDILGGLLAAAGYREDEDGLVPIEIRRSNQMLFSFRTRPLSEDEYETCREKNTKYSKDKRLGGARIPIDVNSSRYRSQLIYTATVKEDREKLWDNHEAWRQLNVLTGIDLVEQVLMPGEKSAIVEKLDEISGYNLTTDEIVKN